MSQTVINPAGQPIAVAGQIADNMPSEDVTTAFNESTVQAPFGAAMAQGSGALGVRVPNALTDIIVGANIWSADHQPAVTQPGGQVAGDIGGSGLLQYARIQLGRRCRFWAPLEPRPIASVAVNDPLFARVIPTGNLWAGSWSNTADASYCVDLSRAGKFRSGINYLADAAVPSGTAGALAEIDFSNRLT